MTCRKPARGHHSSVLGNSDVLWGKWIFGIHQEDHLHGQIHKGWVSTFHLLVEFTEFRCVTMDLQYLYIELPVPYKLSQELEAKLKQFYDNYHYLDMYFPYWVS